MMNKFLIISRIIKLFHNCLTNDDKSDNREGEGRGLGIQGIDMFY